MNLSEIRNEYQRQRLDEHSVHGMPLKQLEQWLNEARDAQCPEYTAMTIATANAEGQPSIRVVLLKYLQDDSLFFFTNYHSRKGRDLAVNQHLAAHFFWPLLERQVKITGHVQKAPASLSDEYFNTRPRESQISALISKQSSEVPSRAALEKEWQAAARAWEGKNIERPDYWGGYQIKPLSVEFWQGRPSRLHDRIVYHKHIDGWHIKRLAP